MTEGRKEEEGRKERRKEGKKEGKKEGRDTCSALRHWFSNVTRKSNTFPYTFTSLVRIFQSKIFSRQEYYHDHDNDQDQDHDQDHEYYSPKYSVDRNIPVQNIQ
jgi:hypothetical protein